MASEVQESNGEYKKYTIIFNLLSPNKMDQVVLECLYKYSEAMKTKDYLDQKIVELCRSSSPICVSLRTRNKDMVSTTYGLQNVIGIIHDIPDYQIVD